MGTSTGAAPSPNAGWDRRLGALAAAVWLWALSASAQASELKAGEVIWLEKDAQGASVIREAYADFCELWRPNRRLQEVFIDYEATGSPGPLACALEVASNEAVLGDKPGDLAPDWQALDAHRVQLRVERTESGDGRVYVVTIRCADPSGSLATQVVEVRVPSWRGNGVARRTRSE